MPSNRSHLDRALQMALDLNERNVGVLGLSFKAGTDDLRDSPVVELVSRLLGKGDEIRIFDRNVNLSRLVGADSAVGFGLFRLTVGERQSTRYAVMASVSSTTGSPRLVLTADFITPKKPTFQLNWHQWGAALTRAHVTAVVRIGDGANGRGTPDIA